MPASVIASRPLGCRFESLSSDPLYIRMSSYYIRPYHELKGRSAMKINRIDHICIAVKNMDAAKKVWEPLLGKSEPDDVYVDEPEKISVARYMVGEVGFELMESTSPEGPVAKWIEKHGEGVMVLSFNVDNTREAIQELEPMGYPFIPTPGGEKRRPFRDCEFAMIHPKKVNNVLLELIDCK